MATFEELKAFEGLDAITVTVNLQRLQKEGGDITDIARTSQEVSGVVRVVQGALVRLLGHNLDVHTATGGSIIITNNQGHMAFGTGYSYVAQVDKNGETVWENRDNSYITQ